VDTHVFRVSNRIGLCKADTVEETERQMTKLIRREKWGNAHHWLIWHGRRVCKAQRPLCETCGLKDLCDAAKAGRF
jgi:endonuclease-3